MLRGGAGHACAAPTRAALSDAARRAFVCPLTQWTDLVIPRESTIRASLRMFGGTECPKGGHHDVSVDLGCAGNGDDDRCLHGCGGGRWGWGRSGAAVGDAPDRDGHVDAHVRERLRPAAAVLDGRE